MGYLTTFTVYNDGASGISKDPKQFADKIYSLIGTRQYEEFHTTTAVNGFVQQSRHADEMTIYVNAGNCVTEVNPYSRGFKDLIKKNPDFARELVAFVESEVVKLKKVLIEEMPIENLTFEEKNFIADNPNTPPEKLDCLAKDKSDWVRSRVAQNPNTSKETLDSLVDFDHWDWLLRFYVAENLNTAPETLNRLSYDENHTVRLRVAKHPNTPSETLERLFYDENSNVSLVAQQTLSEKSKE